MGWCSPAIKQPTGTLLLLAALQHTAETLLGIPGLQWVAMVGGSGSEPKNLFWEGQSQRLLRVSAVPASCRVSRRARCLKAEGSLTDLARRWAQRPSWLQLIENTSYTGHRNSGHRRKPPGSQCSWSRTGQLVASPPLRSRFHPSPRMRYPPGLGRQPVRGTVRSGHPLKPRKRHIVWVFEV